MSRSSSTLARPRALAIPALCAAAVLALSATGRPSEVFAKPPSAAGGINYSSWVTPNGSDADWYAWDDFILPYTQTITEVRWRGGYQNGARLGGHVTDFRISFFDSAANGTQPRITALPEHESQEVVIATFHTWNNAGETVAGTFGGVVMYDYHYTLPKPVTLKGGVKYWFRVVGAQAASPDWGMTTGTVGNGSHFKFNTGLSMFQNWPHDLAFSLHARWADQGNALNGTAGSPKLDGSGTLAPNSTITLRLSSARPSTAAILVVGSSLLNAPLLGGVLVPQPQLLLPLATDSTGALSLPIAMPAAALPPETDLVFQTWILDPLGPQGFAASNGLIGTTP